MSVSEIREYVFGHVAWLVNFRQRRGFRLVLLMFSSVVRGTLCKKIRAKRQFVESASDLPTPATLRWWVSDIRHDTLIARDVCNAEVNIVLRSVCG